MIELSEIKFVRDFITKIFAEQVEKGLQSTSIPLEFDAIACGHLIIEDKKQRGVHGTSAAIRVLGKNEAYNNLISRLINYLLHREKIDAKETSLSTTNNFHWDDYNIIKLSEQLHSLFFVLKGVNGSVNTAILFEDLKKTILDSYYERKENGWQFFTDNKTDKFALLPTSFAIMALSINGGCLMLEKGIQLLVG